MCQNQYPWPDYVTVWYRNRFRSRHSRTAAAVTRSLSQQMPAQRSMRVNTRVISNNANSGSISRNVSGHAQSRRYNSHSNKSSISSDDDENNDVAAHRQVQILEGVEDGKGYTFDEDLARAIAESIQSHDQWIADAEINHKNTNNHEIEILDENTSEIQTKTAITLNNSDMESKVDADADNDCDESIASTVPFNRIVVMNIPEAQFAFLASEPTETYEDTTDMAASADVVTIDITAAPTPTQSIPPILSLDDSEETLGVEKSVEQEHLIHSADFATSSSLKATEVQIDGHEGFYTETKIRDSQVPGDPILAGDDSDMNDKCNDDDNDDDDSEASTVVLNSNSNIILNETVFELNDVINPDEDFEINTIDGDIHTLLSSIPLDSTTIGIQEAPVLVTASEDTTHNQSPDVAIAIVDTGDQIGAENTNKTMVTPKTSDA